MLFTIPEDTLPMVRERLKAGAKLEVRVLDRAQKNELAVGRLDTLDNLIDITTGTVKLRAVFDNPDGTLIPGQFARMRLGQPKPEKVIAVSERGTMSDSPSAFSSGRR